MPTQTSVERAVRDIGLEVPEPRRVLVVDDEPENLEVAEAVLEDSCEVLTAARGAEALEVLERGEPIDVLIADQRMPEMTGVELLSHVARRFPDTVRMVLTAYTDIEPMVAAINSGDVYRFLLKPCDPREMRTVVADALRLKWMRTALHRLVPALAGQNQSLYRTHLELAAAQEQLVQRTRLATLGQLAAGIAHDVRNCSAIISLLIEFMRSKKAAVDEQTLAMAQRMVEGSRPLLELLEHVRRLARTPDEPQRIQPDALVEQVLDSLRRGPGPIPEVSIELPQAAPPLLIDFEAMHQTLLAVLRGTARRSSLTEPLSLALCERGGGLCFEVRGPRPALSGEPLELCFARLTAEAQGARMDQHEGPDGAVTIRLVLPRTPEEQP